MRCSGVIVMLWQGLSDMWMWINIITNKAEGQPSQSSQSRQSSVSPSKTGGSGSPWSKYLYSDQSSYSQSSYAESDYSLPHSPTSSRPSSQVSFYTSSCPTTPLSSRRLCQSPGPYRTAQTVRSPSGKSGVFETLYRPDLIRLSDPRRGQRRSSEAEESSSVRSGHVTPVTRNEIRINNRHFTRSQSQSQSQNQGKNFQPSSQQKNIQRKISEECDQLLRELECDMKNMNNNLIKRSQTPPQPDITGRQVANYNKQVFYINKVKMVELNDVKFSKDSVQEKKVDISSVNNNNTGNNQDYFDSLIKLIENAAKNLSE